MADPTSSKERLTDAQRKKNHIYSERQRREAVRNGFVLLSEIVPGMQDCGRSEVKVLTATVEFIKEQAAKKETLARQAAEVGISVGDFEQMYRNEEKAAEERQVQRQAKANGSSTDGSPPQATNGASKHESPSHAGEDQSSAGDA